MDAIRLAYLHALNTECKTARLTDPNYEDLSDKWDAEFLNGTAIDELIEAARPLATVDGTRIYEDAQK